MGSWVRQCMRQSPLRSAGRSRTSRTKTRRWKKTDTRVERQAGGEALEGCEMPTSSALESDVAATSHLITSNTWFGRGISFLQWISFTKQISCADVHCNSNNLKSIPIRFSLSLCSNQAPTFHPGEAAGPNLTPFLTPT